MIVPPAIRRKISGLEDDLDKLRREVQATVQGFCDENDGFAYSGRRKTTESLAEKIETGRYAKWSDLDDLFGCAIIVPSLAYEAQALDFLQRAFVQVAVKYRGDARKPPDVFRFEATRFVGKLRRPVPASTAAPLYSTNFEVQIRTAFEHACAVTTHSIYKGNQVDWKKQRIAAHLKAAVEQLDLFVLSFESTSEIIEERIWPDLNTKRGIIERFSKWVADGRIPDILAPKDWSRFADNLYSLVSSGFRGRRHLLDAEISKALGILEAEVVNSAHIPHSISLLQFAFGVLTREGMLVPPLERYCPLVTDELIDLYPVVSGFQGAFLIDG